MEDDKLNDKIRETLGSLDGMQRAQPAPYLLTRLQSKLAEENKSGFWARLGTFISRPVTAASGVILFIGINTIVIKSFNNNKGQATTTAGNTAVSRYDFAINVSSIYDIENQEP